MIQNRLKDRICTLFFCHSHSHSHGHSALRNVYPVALEQKWKINIADIIMTVTMTVTVAKKG